LVVARGGIVIVGEFGEVEVTAHYVRPVRLGGETWKRLEDRALAPVALAREIKVINL